MINRKKWMIWSMALPLLFAACSDDVVNDYSDPDTGYDPNADPSSIVINASLTEYIFDAPAGSTLAGSWSEDSEFSLIAKPKSGTQTTTPYEAEPGTIVNNGAYAVFTGDLKWSESNDQYDFYAFYPALPAGADPKEVPVEVPSQQSQTGNSYDHIAAMDFIVAAPVITSSPGLINDPALNTPIEMTFNHLLPVHELRLAVMSRSTVATLNSITIRDNEGNRLAVSDGTTDITNFASADGYASVSGTDYSSEITVNVSESGYLPTASRYDMTTIPSVPAPASVFPVRFVSLPGDFRPRAEPPTPEPGEEPEEVKNMVVTVNYTEYIVDPDTEAVISSEDKTYEVAYAGENYVRGMKYTQTLVFGEEKPEPNLPWDGSIADGPRSIDHTTMVIEIGTATELAWLAAFVNKDESLEDPGIILDTSTPDYPNFLSLYTVRLIDDIDLNDLEWTPIGTYFTAGANPINHKTFKGVFDGQGHTVSGMRITQAPDLGTAYGYGLFGWVYRVKSIGNVTVTGDIELSGDGVLNVGGIVGKLQGVAYNSYSYVENARFEGNITVTSNNSGTSVGGIAGHSTYITYDRCSTAGELTAEYTGTSSYMVVGGISTRSSNYENCWNDMDINVTGGTYTGGIVGYPSGQYVKGCKNSGNITVDANGMQGVVGGIGGFWMSTGELMSCYNTGDITVTNQMSGTNNYPGVGGLMGTLYSNNRIVQGCYSTGNVSSSGGDLASRYGNFVGHLYSVTGFATILNNYISGIRTGTDLDTGLDGRVTQFAAGSWPADGTEGWNIGAGEDNKYWKNLGSFGGSYPVLWWEE